MRVDDARRRDVAGVVLAAGSGRRFGGPKQFATLAGERLVDRAVRVLTAVAGPPVLVLPAGTAWDGADVRAVVPGGGSRGASVRSAVTAVDRGAAIVVVHDIARPLTSEDLVRRLIAAVAAGADCAVPTWAPPDTLKFVHPDGRVEHRGREGYVVAQSPMAFDAAALRRVVDTPGDPPVEESVAVSRLAGRVVTVPGDPWSHHVVTRRDLAIMERLLAGDASWTPDREAVDGRCAVHRRGPITRGRGESGRGSAGRRG